MTAEKSLPAKARRKTARGGYENNPALWSAADKKRGFTDADLRDVSDNPEWTAQELRDAKPFAEMFPDLAASIRRGRGKQKSPTKEQVTMRLTRSTLDAFRADGPGWQAKIDKELTRIAERKRGARKSA